MSIPMGLSFDVDMIAPTDPPHRRDLSNVSNYHYGIVRALGRITSLLEEFEAPATFFVTGLAAEMHPGPIRELDRAGHEVGHHGYRHLAPTAEEPAVQYEEVHRGLEAIEAATGRRPVGYRAPGFAMTMETLRLIAESGFTYDSSLMGDDRPYRQEAGSRTIVEVPVHWSLDDVPHIGVFPGLFQTADPAMMTRHWWNEIESAISEGRPATFCLHPTVVGRGWVLPYLADFLRRAHEDPRVQFETHATIAERFRDPV